MSNINSPGLLEKLSRLVTPGNIAFASIIAGVAFLASSILQTQCNYRGPTFLDKCMERPSDQPDPVEIRNKRMQLEEDLRRNTEALSATIGDTPIKEGPGSLLENKRKIEAALSHHKKKYGDVK